jgi:hypothetical protein
LNPAAQILPTGNLGERAVNRCSLGHPFFEQSLVPFFQVRGDFRVDFVLLFGIKGEAGEAVADEFLPIRH